MLWNKFTCPIDFTTGCMHTSTERVDARGDTGLKISSALRPSSYGQNIQMRKICLLHTSVAGDNILANKQYIATHFEFYVLTNAPESNHRAPWGEKVLQYNWRIKLWIMKGFQLRWDNINIIFPNTTNPFQHSATSTPPNIIFLILIATGQTRTGNEQMKLTHMSTINVTLIDKLLQVDAPGWS